MVPTAEMIGIVRPYVAEVLAGTPWLDDLIPFNRRSDESHQRTRGVIRQLRAHKFDTLVLGTNSFRAAAMAWLGGARQRVGYVRYGRGPLLTHKLYHPRYKGGWLPTPAIDAYLQLAYAVGAEWESPRIELATMPADEAAADAAWKTLGLPPGDQVVVLNSGGAYGAAKVWPSEYYAELARRIAVEQGLSVLVACGPSERAAARRIVELADHPSVVSLAEEPMSIGLTKACIRRSRLLVSTDSGPRFFAVAFRRAADLAVWPHAPALEPHALRPRAVPATCRAVRPLRAADLSIGTSRLHAEPLGRPGLQGRARTARREAHRLGGLEK